MSKSQMAYRKSLRVLCALRFALCSRKGFSYAEFLVIAVLVVIAVGGASLSLINFTKREEPRNVIQGIAATISDARERARAGEEELYWGVRFENIVGRDRYTLIKAATAGATTSTIASTVYLSNATPFTSPATSTLLMFNKITGALTPACPAGNIGRVITVNTMSVYIYCNGKVEY